MADAKQPPTETDSPTTIVEKGTLGTAVDFRVVPRPYGTYAVEMSGGTIPRELSGKYTTFELAKQAIEFYFSNEIQNKKKLEAFIDPKLKEQLRKRKEERNAESNSG
jgi:hypothetical protein